VRLPRRGGRVAACTEAKRYPVAARIDEAQVDEPYAGRARGAAVERRLCGEPAKEIQRARFPCRSRQRDFFARGTEARARLPARFRERQERRIQARDESVGGSLRLLA